MCDKDNCNCGGTSCCGDCEPWNCLEQQINDALATKEDQFQGYVDEAKDAAAESKASAEASAQSAAESKEFRDEAELAASTAVAAEGIVVGVANTLQDTADKLEQIADELNTAISGIAVSTWYYTAVSENQTVIPVPADKNEVDIQSIYIEGARQEPNRGFVFDKLARTITLAEGIPLGLEIAIVMGTYSDNSNDFAHTLASNNGANLVGTSSGSTVQEELNSLDYQLTHMPYGSPSEGVYYRLGVNYESTGTSSSLETRPFYHDFRPLGTADGGDALFSTDGCNMFMGPGAGNFTMRPVAQADLPAGIDYKLQCSHNIAYGWQALGQLTIGYKNTAIGTNAWRKLTTGHGNTAVGRDCGHEMTTGNDNSFYGFTAGQLMATGNYNCIFGVSASYNNVDGTGNTVTGRRAGFQQTAGDYNMLYGEQAGFGLVTGSYNTFIGKCNVSTGLTQGDSNLILGSRITGLQDENRQVILADGAGNKTLEVHKDSAAVTKKASYLDLPSYEATPFNAAATDGQVAAGSSLILRSLANVGNAITQVVFQSRAGQPYSRIVSTGAGAGQLVFINDNVERLRLLSAGGVNPGADNAQPLGSSSRRWSEIFSATGVINTSDKRAKTEIVELDDLEREVALELKKLIRRYRFKDSVTEKGLGGARYHYGIIAQDVIKAFADKGLDAADYGILCHSQWKDEYEEITKAVEDENGDIHYVGTGTYTQLTVAGEGYGIRYEELLCFIIAAI